MSAQPSLHLSRRSLLRLPPGGARQVTDIDIARFGASVELAAVQTYQLALDSGRVTDAAVGQVATLFQGHHREHAGAFNALLADNGAPEVGANQAMLDAFGPQITGAADQTAILEIAFGLEQALASTHLFALGGLSIDDAQAAVTTILPVESQHAVVLGFVLGKALGDYVPTFESGTQAPGTAAAFDPTQFPVG